MIKNLKFGDKVKIKEQKERGLSGFNTENLYTIIDIDNNDVLPVRIGNHKEFGYTTFDNLIKINESEKK